MKKTNRLTQSLLVTAACFGTVATLNAQSQPGQNQTGQTGEQPGTHQYTGQDSQQSQQGSQYRQDNRLTQDQRRTAEQYRSTSTNQYHTYGTTMSSGSGLVTKANKASSLIGMNVKNQSGENLGEIKDIVINLDQDRVSYAVLQTGMSLMGTGKLHAVPLRAFQSSADGDHLILNADKDKLARSEGFDKDNWPNLNSPAWGAEPFWHDNSGMREMKGTEGSRFNEGTRGAQGSRSEGSRRDANGQTIR